MNPGERARPGTVVSPEEFNALITRIRDLQTHMETNRRHLVRIEARLAVLVEDVRDLVPEEEDEIIPEPEIKPESESMLKPKLKGKKKKKGTA